MWKISNYTGSYFHRDVASEQELLEFFSFSRQLGCEGVSLNIRNLAAAEPGDLKRIRRALLDHGLSLSMFTVNTDFGLPQEEHAAEHARASEAIRAAAFLGAPLLRVFAGAPPHESQRRETFLRAAAAVRKLCEEAAGVGLPIGLQNHNNGALCGTGGDVLRFIKEVDHQNLVHVLDTGEFAGSPGASHRDIKPPPGSNYLESIRQTAPLARYVRVKFYEPGPDGADAALDYPKIFDILRSIHYAGFLDIVYQGQVVGENESPRTALPRIADYLRTAAQMAPREKGEAQAEGRYADLDTRRYLAEAEVRTEVQVAFLEGPACDADGREVFFTNGSTKQILRWAPQSGRLSVFREQSNGANGLQFDRQGRLLACESGGRVTRTDLKTGRMEVLVEKYEGRPIGAPNDLALDAKGRIYFTSRFPTIEPPEQVNGVYRIDADGTVTRILATPQVERPNGIVTSPDDKTLYVIDSNPQSGGARRIRAYELHSDGTVGAQRLLYDFHPGRGGDGMDIDVEGNLYVAAGLHRSRGRDETLDVRPGIHVISPVGKLLAFIETPEDSVTNCGFGGHDRKTLYITCGKKLLSVKTRIHGKPL
jgi:gluconolactonase